MKYIQITNVQRGFRNKRFLNKILGILVIFVLVLQPELPLYIASSEEGESAPPAEESAPPAEESALPVEESTPPAEESALSQETQTEGSDETSDADTGSNGDQGSSEGNGTPAHVETGNADSSTDVQNTSNINETDINLGGEPTPSPSPEGEPQTEGTSDETGTETVTENTGSEEDASSTPETLGQDASSTPETVSEDENQEQQEIPEACKSPEQQTTDASSTPEILGEDASSTSETLGEGGDSADTTITVDNENETDLCNQVQNDADTGNNTANDNPDGADIDTGDSSTETNVENIANINDTTIDDECAEGEEGCDANPDHDTEIEVNNTNDAEIGNDIGSDSNTGQNEANNNDGDTNVGTGNASGETNVSNVGNVNSTGDGEVVIIDIYGNAEGDLDVSDYGGESSGSDVRDSDTVVDNSTRVNNSSSSYFRNDIDLSVNSGGNTAENNNGNVNLITGTVDAVVNLSNLANANLTGDGWKFILVNIFGGWLGDLILPNPSLRQDKNGGALYTDIENENEGQIANNVNINAESGKNAADNNTGTTNQKSGNVNAQTTVFNDVNTSIFGNFWDFVKIRVFGFWDGFVYGLPEGVNYVESDGEIIIFNNPEAYEEYLEYDASLVVSNSNNAVLENNVNVDAVSGENNAGNNNGDVSVETGDVNAKVNIANQVNTNFTGSGWNAAFINVFGSWVGGLYFGKPDLFVTESVVVDGDPTQPGSLVTYRFEFGNNGDGRATNVLLTDDFAESILSLHLANSGIDINGGVQFNIGSLEVDETGSFEYTTRVKEDMPSGTFEVTNFAIIDASEDDRNEADNTASGMFLAQNIQSPQGGNGGFQTAVSGGSFHQESGIPTPATLTISKTHKASGSVYAGDTVSFEVVVQNVGDLPAFDTVLEDIMSDEIGNEIAKNIWDLGTVYGREKVTVNYDVQFSVEAVSGMYTNKAHAEGWNDYARVWIGAIAESHIQIEGRDPSLPVENETTEDVSNPPVEVTRGSVEVSKQPPVVAGIVYAEDFFINHPINQGDEENQFDIERLRNTGIVLGADSADDEGFFDGSAGALFRIFSFSLMILFLLFILMILVEKLSRRENRRKLSRTLRLTFGRLKDIASTSLFDLF